jgi:hypothetical protein
MSNHGIPRRNFLKGVAAGAAILPALSPALLAQDKLRDYRGPNVVIVRFGGGVRRRETIDPGQTYAPFLCHDLAKRGTLFNNMEIEQLEGVETSHGQGTLYIVTASMTATRTCAASSSANVSKRRCPPSSNICRKQFNVPEHQTLIVNGEDRTNEEFYTFSNHHLFGCELPLQRAQPLPLQDLPAPPQHRTRQMDRQRTREQEKGSRETRKPSIFATRKRTARAPS